MFRGSGGRHGAVSRSGPELLYEEPQRVLGLEGLRKHDDGRIEVTRPDVSGRLQSFVRMSRRHPDVHDGDVRTEIADARQKGVGVSDLGDDLDVVLNE